MPFGKILPTPGINTEFSTTLNRAGWSGSNLMRWRMGLPEKIGGWTPLSETPVTGTGLGMHSWADNVGNAYCMVGTESRLQVITRGVLYDITPQRDVADPAVSFSTINVDSLVTITDAGSNTAAGDWVYLVVPVSVGGLVLQGYYLIDNVISSNSYQVDAGSNATATVVAGGAVPVFDTTNTSAIITVTLANHGLSTGNLFVVEVSTVVGGITINGSYPVTVVDADHFTIVGDIVAVATATGSENGGNARIIYLIASGLASNVILSGYGIGPYGAGPYGLSSGSPGSSVVAPMRQWTGDSWGEELVCNYIGGSIYRWPPPVTAVYPGNIATNPATLIAAAPTQVTCIFVHTQAEILVACGCNKFGTFDPLLVAWCDQDDLNEWTFSSSNFAGSYRLKSGSRIVGARMASAQSGLIWTDTGLHAAQFVGYPDTFIFTQVGYNCGLISLRAHGQLNTSVFWMGHDNFFISSPGGMPTTLPCTVWDVIFRNLNSFQIEKIQCAVNPLFNEVAWYFPSASGDGSVDTYVKYNTIENLWDWGYLTRTCWDEGLVFGYPMGCDGASLVQQHETSTDANGTPIAYSWTTGYFDIDEGGEFMALDQIWPDFIMTSGAVVQVTVNVVDYPDGPVRTYGPYTVTEGTKKFIALNARGRQMQVTFSGNDLGSFVRQGATRYRYAAAGRRGGG